MNAGPPLELKLVRNRGLILDRQLWSREPSISVSRAAIRSCHPTCWTNCRDRARMRLSTIGKRISEIRERDS
jgi:hypothetical protein